MAWALSAPSSPAPGGRTAARLRGLTARPTQAGEHPCRKWGAVGRRSASGPQMTQGNISVRQRALASGAFLAEATRSLIQIVALQLGRFQHTSPLFGPARTRS